MSRSITIDPSESLRIRPSRAGLVAVWALQVVLAGMFFLAGVLKLTGAPEMVTLFDSIGVGQWFRYVTGLVELLAGIALLVPSLAVYGALLLVPTMIGAIATHLFIVGGSSVLPALLLLGALVIVWARRDQISSSFLQPKRVGV